MTMRAVLNTSATTWAPVHSDVYADPDFDAWGEYPGAGTFYYDTHHRRGSDHQFGVLDDAVGCWRTTPEGRTFSDCSTAIAVLELTFSSPLKSIMAGGNHWANPMSLVVWDDSSGSPLYCWGVIGGCSYSHDPNGANQRVKVDSIIGNVSRVWVSFMMVVGCIN